MSCRASCQTPAICRTKRFLSLPTLPSVSPVKCCLEIPLSSVTRRCISWSSWTSRQAATSLDSHSLDMYVFHVNLCHVHVHCLQCFDTVCWASGIASGLQKLSDEVLVCYLSRIRCRLFAYGPADATTSPNPISSCLT